MTGSFHMLNIIVVLDVLGTDFVLITAYRASPPFLPHPLVTQRMFGWILDKLVRIVAKCLEPLICNMLLLRVLLRSGAVFGKVLVTVST